MRVIATAVGFDGKQLRQPGTEFDMPDGSRGSWFTPVKVKPAEKTAKAEKAAPSDGNDLA